MSRLVALGALFISCKGPDRGPLHDGISRVQVEVAHNDGTYLEVSYSAKLVDPPLSDSHGVELKAACQVGADRLVVSEPPQGELIQGKAIDIDDRAFLLNPLPAKPSMCELTFSEASYKTPRELGRVCWDGAIKEGPCPPNRVPDAGVGPTGVTAIVTSVRGEDADDIGFPAHLTVEYRVTAHKDMPPGAYLVRSTTCEGTSFDRTWHSELEHLRAGESFTAAQNTYKIGRPARGTACQTLFGFSPVVDGEITKIAAFCHRDQAITVGPCP